MIKLEDLSQPVRRMVRRDFIGDSPVVGWYAVNSVHWRECVPCFRAPGGGVVAAALTDLPEAFDQSIRNVETLIAGAQQHLKDLQAARKAVAKNG